jgi:hypothetical protein
MRAKCAPFFSLPCSDLFFDLSAFGGLFLRPFFFFYACTASGFFIGVALPLLVFCAPFFLAAYAAFFVFNGLFYLLFRFFFWVLFSVFRGGFWPAKIP